VLTTNIPKLAIPPEDFAWLQEEVRRLLAACRVEAHDGTPLYTPDAQGHYGALWTRDFCYMVEGAPRLVPAEEVRAGIGYLLHGQREDGAIPDRVEPDGTPVYCAGPRDAPLGSRPPTDNPQFLVKLVSEYFALTTDFAFVEAHIPALWRALESLPRSADGAVYIDAAAPHSGYGFTDTVAKTGAEWFSTLLLWEAWQLMGRMARRLEDHELAHDAYEQADRVHRAFPQFWDAEFGMMVAAMYECRQFDLWGSAYAVRIGAAGSRQRHAIARFIADLYEGCVLRGHVRHLVAGQYWERMLIPVSHDTYQNGGYWAVPSGWVARCLLSAGHEDLAHRLIRDLLAEFRRAGVCEWISKDENARPGYVASAALLLDAVKPERPGHVQP
jgi:glycogen debranching enzyme